MQQENLSTLRALKQNIEELIAPLDAGQVQFYGEDGGKIESSLDLIMGELIMVVLLLTDLDNDISALELELMNDMRHVVYGYGIPELDSDDSIGLRRQFLHIYPKRFLTLDQLPLSIRVLDIYDGAHDTAYATKARNLFVQFAEAMIKADKDENPLEGVLWGHFKAILSGEVNDES